MSKLEKIIKDSEQAYLGGCSCGEAVTTAFHQNYPEQIDVCIIPMSSNMLAGMGVGSVCGAITGAVMVLGALFGRKTPAEKPKPEILAMSKEFMPLIKAKFDSFECPDIKAGPLGINWEQENCLRVVSATAEVLAKFLAEKKTDPTIKNHTPTS